MDSGIEIIEIERGDGPVVSAVNTVIAHVKMSLSQGEVVYDTIKTEQPMRINLKKRECIAGLRKGIEGMREGGRRSLKISPHLAYGARGWPGHVPPNAVIYCEIHLLEVRNNDAIRPEDVPPGKHLHVSHPGEAARNLPRWQFWLNEDGRCGISLFYPIPGTTWRHTRQQGVAATLDQEETKALFEDAFALLKRFPEECFANKDLWADTTEPSNSIARSRRDNTLCLDIGVTEKREQLCYYSMPETSPALQASRILKTIQRLIREGPVS